MQPTDLRLPPTEVKSATSQPSDEKKPISQQGKDQPKGFQHRDADDIRVKDIIYSLSILCKAKGTSAGGRIEVT
mgnify:CR=1 FL=1